MFMYNYWSSFQLLIIEDVIVDNTTEPRNAYFQL